MDVQLIDYTGAGTSDPARHAAEILLFAKSTRLELSPKLQQQIRCMTDDQMTEELFYIANTIPSSWEFVHYTFLIRNVTRAFTHQLVRTRTASFAQQTHRMLDARDFSYSTGPSISPGTEAAEVYHNAMRGINLSYRKLVEEGVKPEDARGILPTNILTNIIMGINLRNFVSMGRKRSSSRVQAEYRKAVLLMRDEVLKIHPWTKFFLDRDVDKAAVKLDQEIRINVKDNEQATMMIKLLDQIREGE